MGQEAVQLWEILAQADGEPQRKDHPLETFCDGQEEPGSSTLAAPNHWLGKAQGARGLCVKVAVDLQCITPRGC